MFYKLAVIMAVMLFCESAFSQRAGRARFKQNKSRIEQNNNVNKRQSKISVWETMVMSNRTNISRARQAKSRRLINTFKEKYGMKEMHPKLQNALLVTLATNREAMSAMNILSNRSKTVAERQTQLTKEEHLLRAKIVESIALSGRYQLSSYLKETAASFGQMSAENVTLRTRILQEAISRMEVVSPETRHFGTVMNQVLVRNSIGKSKRRQCM